MAGQRERTQKLLEEFMGNTGTDRDEALEILTRNRWNLSDSYYEIEQMCISSGRNQAQTKNIMNKQPAVTGSPHHIDMGLGAAVNLNKTATQTNTYAGRSQQVQDSTKDSVRFPSSSKPQERIIPIQVEGSNRIVGGGTHHSNQSRVVLDNAVHPSQPSMVAPQMTRGDAVDDEEDDVFDDKMAKRPPHVSTYPRLKRGFSNILENESLVSEARYNVQVDIKKDNHDNMYMHSFVLPDLTVYNADFRAFLEKELIESSTLVSLEQAGRLNWWAEMRLCQRLLPMATSGDGNCLLHAASLAMWGIHDRQLILRKELYETLTKAPYKETLYRRWRYQQTMVNKESGLVFDEPEWKKEWENILHLASPLPRGATDPPRSNNCCDGPLTVGGSHEESVVYESLEEFHVFVLSHVLQRPILVVADTILMDAHGEALAPIPFPGIYLPLEVQHTHKAPLLLTYDAAHFSALPTMKQDTTCKLPAAIPLVDPDLKLLPLHFFVDPGPKVDWSKGQVFDPSLDDRINVLQKLLDVDRIPVPYSDTNGDSDLGSCGSQESEESLTKDKKEDKKKDARKSQQMQSVAKQFGSIGKSMGKKLKQLGKKGEKSQRPGVGNEITQSTRIMSLYGPQGNGRDVVLIAHLSLKGSPQQEQLIENYLENAKDRFKHDREMKRLSDIELRSRVSNPTSVCSTPGCSSYGTEQTNYLCYKCYDIQIRESSVSQRLGGQYVYNTFPGRVKLQGPPNTSLAPVEIFCYGKSKFYTSSNEDLDQLPAPKSTQYRHSGPVTTIDCQASRPSSNVNVPRSLTQDYDSVGSVVGQRESLPYHPQARARVHETRPPCRTARCPYFGNPELAGYCLQCSEQSHAWTTRSTNIHTKL